LTHVVELFDPCGHKSAKAAAAQVSTAKLTDRLQQEVGSEDTFNTDEINEIKELYDKA
jgi:hypothetical protein